MVKNIFICLSFCLFWLTAESQSSKSLSECIEIALQNNITLEQSQLEVESNSLQLTQSKANLFPTINGFGSHGYNWGQTIDPFTNQFATSRIQSNSFGLNTAVTLFSGFAMQNQVKLAEVNLKISELGIESSRNGLAISVSNAFLLVLFNQEIAKVNAANLESSRENLNRIQKLVDVGQLPEANLYQVQAQVASDEAMVIRTKNDIKLAMLSLMQLLQLPLEERSEFNISVPEMTAPNFSLPNKEDVLRHALHSFPEMQSAEVGILSASLNKKIAAGMRYPRLSASFNFGTGFSGANQEGIGEPMLTFTPIGFVDGTTQTVLSAFPSYEEFQTKPFFSQLGSNVNRSFFLNLTVPIFNGLSNSTNVQLAEISERQAELNLKNTQNNLSQTVESAYADAEAAYNNYRAAELSLKAQEEAFKYAKVRFEQQVINGMEYSQARATRDAASAEKLRNLYDYIFKLKILEFYQGKPITLN